MNNAPQVKIQYLVNYDLEISGQDGVSGLDTSVLSPLSDLSNINNQDAKLRGKKGFILSGGSVDDVTGEVSGVLLDGTYTFFSDAEKSYNGIMGYELSSDMYQQVTVTNKTSGEFYVLDNGSYVKKTLPQDYIEGIVYYQKYYGFEEPQYITIKAKNENTYIRSLLIYFDPETTFTDSTGNKDAKECATKISFSNAKKYDIETGEIVDDATYDGTPIDNDRMVFLHNFGENSTLTQVQINILGWSKKQSLMKILKIVTGYTGIYDKTNLMKFDFTINKTNDAQQLRFGVSSNNCTVDVLDNDLMIDTLYKKDLIYKNIQVQISVDGVMQGIFYINEKNSEKGSNEWVFDCVDRLESLKDIKRPMMAIGERTIYKIMNDVLSGIVSNVVWEKSAKEYCSSVTIPKSYFKTGQTLYNLMLKCCQVGLLRVYIDRNDNCKITGGL